MNMKNWLVEHGGLGVSVCGVGGVCVVRFVCVCVCVCEGERERVCVCLCVFLCVCTV